MGYHPRVLRPISMLAVLGLLLPGCTGSRSTDDRAPKRGAAAFAAPRPDPSLALLRRAKGGPAIQKMSLPKTAGAWTRPDGPKRIDESTIFSYMDGAGEMYVGYRFDHLDVYEYTAPGRDSILVELYWMRSSDDGFGLLSNDWGGQAVVLGASEDIHGLPGATSRAVSDEPVPTSRALYGAGLLRLWSDDLYARVLAGRETPESREQVWALGRAIVAGRPVAARPALLRVLPERIGETFRLRRDRVWFLRSHLVLNSAYFLSSQNILDLSLACEAAIAAYDAVRSGPTSRADSDARRPVPTPGQTARPHLLVIRYPDAATARRAFEHFLGAYLPEARVPTPGAAAAAQRIEHGWVGFRLQSQTLIVALDAPDEAAANTLVETAARNAGPGGGR